MGQSLAEYAERLAEYAERQQGTEEVPSSDVSKVRDNNPLTRKMFNRDSTANAIMEQGSDNSDPVLGGIAEIYKPRKSLAQDVDALVEATPLTPGELTETLLMGEPPAEAQTKLLDEAGIPKEEQTTVDWATYAHAFAEKMMAPLAKGEDGSTFGSVIGAMTHAGKVTHDEFKEVLKDDKEWDRKLKEAQAKADKAAEASLKGKTRTIYNEETGRDVVYRDVPQWTKGAIPDDLHPGRWIRPEPKKPTKGLGKGTGSKLKPDMMKTIADMHASNAGFAVFENDPETSKSLAMANERMNAYLKNPSGYDSREMDTIVRVMQGVMTGERASGKWTDLTKTEQAQIIENARAQAIKDIEDGSETDVITAYGKRVNDGIKGINWELPGSAKTDTRFSTGDYGIMADYLGDMVGKDLDNSWLEFDWLDIMAYEPVNRALQDGFFTKDQFELLQEDPAQAQLFMNDVAAKLRDVSDLKGTNTDQLSDAEIEEVMMAGLSNLSGGIDKWGPYNQAPSVSSFDEFIPEPRDITAFVNTQHPNPLVWEHSAEKGYGYRDQKTQKFMTYIQLMDRMKGTR